MQGSHYGTVPAAEAPSHSSGGVSQRRMGRVASILALALALCAVAGTGIVMHRSSASPSLRPVELLPCDEIQCMMNSPTAPPGMVASEPRILSPAEVGELKEALETETSLEQQVGTRPTNTTFVCLCFFAAPVA